MSRLEDVGRWLEFVRRVGGVFEDGGGRFRVAGAHGLFALVAHVPVVFGLLEGLGECGLAGPRGASVGSDLCPPFAEEVAEFPARLDRGAEQFFIGVLALALALPDAEEHFGKGPAGAQERVGLVGLPRGLLHEPVAEGDVEVEGALAEGLG